MSLLSPSNAWSSTEAALLASPEVQKLRNQLHAQRIELAHLRASGAARDALRAGQAEEIGTLRAQAHEAASIIARLEDFLTMAETTLAIRDPNDWLTIRAQNLMLDLGLEKEKAK